MSDGTEYSLIGEVYQPELVDSPDPAQELCSYGHVLWHSDRPAAFQYWDAAREKGSPIAHWWLAQWGDLPLETRRVYFQEAVRRRPNMAFVDYLKFLLHEDPVEAEKYMDRAYQYPTTRHAHLFCVIDDFMMMKTESPYDNLEEIFAYCFKYERWDLFQKHRKFYDITDEITHIYLQVPGCHLKTTQQYIKAQYLQLMWYQFMTTPSYFAEKKINRDIWGILVGYFESRQG